MKEAWKEVDRRKYPRFPVTIRCWCETPTVTKFIAVEDISEAGLRLRTAIPLLVGQRACLSWKIGGDREIVAEVEVVWRNDGTRQEAKSDFQPGMGVRILKVLKGVEDLRGFLTATGQKVR